MRFEFHRTGAERKALVKAISEITGETAVYQYMPTCAYEIGSFTVTKEGVLECADGNENTESLLEQLAGRGFLTEAPETAQEAAESESEETRENNAVEAENKPQGANVGLTVELPREGFTDTALENLHKLVEAKETLIKKALAVEALPIEVSEVRVSFPWFSETDGDSAKAYTHFISALCDMARNQKRVTAKEKETANEKYAFRCFLLRLGFIGAEYKAERKILLQNLCGNSAFKSQKEILRPEPVNPSMRMDMQEHPDLTEELLDELLIQQVNHGFGGGSDEISE